jgi:hypothetical protein
VTKGFLHGRTEAGRSCTPELCAFTAAYADPAAPREQRIEKLRTAIKARSPRAAALLARGSHGA